MPLQTSVYAETTVFAGSRSIQSIPIVLRSDQAGVTRMIDHMVFLRPYLFVFD